MNKLLKYSIALLSLSLAGAAHSALLYRGNNMAYDTVLNVTWLMDANYAKTSGYDADGQMTWSQSKAWVEQLQYSGFDGWRLASIDYRDTTCSRRYSRGGFVFFDAYSCHSSTNELAYMLSENLGLHSYKMANGSINPLWTATTGSSVSNSFTDAQTNVNYSILNLKPFTYWSGITDPQYSTYAWTMNAGTIGQDYSIKTSSHYAWAVRDGDVGPAVVSEKFVPFYFLFALMIAFRMQRN